MSELQIEGQELQVGAKAAWELTAEELVFPFEYTIAGQVRTVFLHMHQYRAFDLKQLLAAINSRILAQDGTREIIKGGKEATEAVEEFFWKYFSRLSRYGGPPQKDDPTLEHQKEWIKKNPRYFIPRQVILEGFGEFNIKPKQIYDPAEKPNGDSATADFFTLELTETITLIQKLFFAGVGQVPLEMAHSFRRETATECYRYERATDRGKIHKDEAFERTTNYDVLEQLYDTLIESIDGVTIKGEACTPANKEAWVKLVPFWHKYWMLTEFFRGVQSKNG